MIDVLVVDDDPVFAQVLARSLERRGFGTVVAHDTAAALALTVDRQPARAIVDLRIDEESGLVLIPALLAAHPALRIVMLTGYASIATAVDAVKRGAVNYLCKPASAEEILAAFDEPASTAEPPLPTVPISVGRLEWEHIQRVLQEHDGNVSATARALGMHRRTLQRKLQKRPVRR